MQEASPKAKADVKMAQNFWDRRYDENNKRELPSELRGTGDLLTVPAEAVLAFANKWLMGSEKAAKALKGLLAILAVDKAKAHNERVARSRGKPSIFT